MELCCEIMCVAERVVAGYLADLDPYLSQTAWSHMLWNSKGVVCRSKGAVVVMRNAQDCNPGGYQYCGLAMAKELIWCVCLGLSKGESVFYTQLSTLLSCMSATLKLHHVTTCNINSTQDTELKWLAVALPDTLLQSRASSTILLSTHVHTSGGKNGQPSTLEQMFPGDELYYALYLLGEPTQSRAVLRRL